MSKMEIGRMKERTSKEREGREGEHSTVRGARKYAERWDAASHLVVYESGNFVQSKPVKS